MNKSCEESPHRGTSAGTHSHAFLHHHTKCEPRWVFSLCFMCFSNYAKQHGSFFHSNMDAFFSQMHLVMRSKPGNAHFQWLRDGDGCHEWNLPAVWAATEAAEPRCSKHHLRHHWVVHLHRRARRFVLPSFRRTVCISASQQAVGKGQGLPTPQAHGSMIIAALQGRIFGVCQNMAYGPFILPFSLISCKLD